MLQFFVGVTLILIMQKKFFAEPDSVNEEQKEEFEKVDTIN